MTFNIRVSNGLLEPKHVRSIGPALWVFLLLLDKQTDDLGTVNGGFPLKNQDIADRLGFGVQTVRDHLSRLRKAGYISEADEGCWRVVNAKSRRRKIEPKPRPERHTEAARDDHPEPSTPGNFWPERVN